MSNRISHFYEFADFRFDAEKRVLWRSGEIVSLTPKSAEVLLLLVESGGNLLERDELLQKVWQDTFVEEGNLNNAISTLRKTLGGNGIIQTVPRRGYRFTSDVREVFDKNGETDFVIEKLTLSQTLIEEREEVENEKLVAPPKPEFSRFYIFATFAGLLSLLALGSFWLFRGDSPAGKTSGFSQIKSIAVLPLKSFAPDSESEPLRLRITDALITRLGSFDKISVRPTASVLKFGEGQDAIEAGKKLKVDAVLDGRVQIEKDRLRVTLQLILVNSGEQFWSEQFDGRANEILALQDKISNSLRQKLAFAATGKNTLPTENNEAYEAYLKGRFLWNQRRAESYWKALEYFLASTEADPNFALGYTGIADCYYLLEQRNAIQIDEAYRKAETAARKALELDPALAEAHTSIAIINFVYYSRWTDAETHFRRAVELNPNYAEAHAQYGMLLNAAGRFDEAFTELKKAESLDPTSLNIAIYLGANFYFSKQFDRAISQFQRVLEFAPNTERAHFFLSRIYELSGRYTEAVESALKEREIARPQTLEPLRLAYRTGGIRGFWQKQVELLKEESLTIHGLDHQIASRYAMLGDADGAFSYIEKSLKNRGAMRNFGRVDPSFDSLSSNPKFQELLKTSLPD